MQQAIKSSVKVCFPFFIFFFLLTFYVKDNAFFWDNVLQASKYAHFFLENNFTQLILPLELDAGHPPFFGVYLALVWKMFGKSLPISHFAMLPWLLGIVWQLYRFIRFYFSNKDIFWVLLLTCSNVILLGQSSLVSPDVVLLFCFLFATNGILYQKKEQIILGTIGMSLLSIRGIVLISSLLVFQVYQIVVQEKRIRKKDLAFILASFLPVVLVAGGYYTVHFLETGWWISTPNEGWVGHRGITDFTGFLRKIIILGWRFLDFGMVAFWGVFFWLMIKLVLNGNKNDLKFKQLIGLPFILLIIFLPLFLLLNNPIAHRYLMPIVLTFAIATTYLIFNVMVTRKSQLLIVGFIFLVQFSGNFWVYPKQIAQGWDGTLAHLPYYHLRKEMIHFIDENQIPYNIVGTEFPMTSKMKFLDLNGSEVGFRKKDIEKDMYILYSSVFNDFSDEALESLETDFTIIKSFYSNQIYMVLYKRKE